MIGLHNGHDQNPLGPVYPVWQSQRKEPGVLTHLPPCSQGVPTPLHSLMSWSHVAPV